MKLAAVLCVFLFASVWALPQTQKDVWIKRLFVRPRVDQHPLDVGPRITGGTEVAPHSIPYQAYLIIMLNSGSGWECGGSLISTKHVLTAGHCLDDGSEATVTLGAHNVRQQESTQVVVTSRNLIVHPDYSRATISNDIGIIVFSQAVKLNEYIQTIALPSSASSDYLGANARVSGWGLTVGNGNTSPVLLEVYSPVISNSQCRQVFDIVIDSQICTLGSGAEGHCEGDSGGPLDVDGVLIGVVSYGAEGCPPRLPSAYTRVTSYLSWIKQHTNV